MKGLLSGGGGAMSLPDAKIIESYSDGKSCAEIAELNYCSETSVYNQLKSLGVIMRSRSEANQIFPDYIFIALYNMGLSVSQIGRLLDINSSTVTKRLHTLQFPLRSRPVASRIRYTEEEFQQHFMALDILNQLSKGGFEMGLVGQSIVEFDFFPDAPPAVIGELITGKTVNIELWKDGVAVSICTSGCTEINGTGRYSWSTSGIPTLAASREQFHWRMSGGGTTDDGDFVLISHENRDSGMPSLLNPSSYIVQN